MIYCKKCTEEIEKYEHYIKFQDGTIMHEGCFIDYAAKELKAEMKQEGFEQYENED